MAHRHFQGNGKEHGKPRHPLPTVQEIKERLLKMTFRNVVVLFYCLIYAEFFVVEVNPKKFAPSPPKRNNEAKGPGTCGRSRRIQSGCRPGVPTTKDHLIGRPLAYVTHLPLPTRFSCGSDVIPAFALGRKRSENGSPMYGFALDVASDHLPAAAPWSWCCWCFWRRVLSGGRKFMQFSVSKNCASNRSSRRPGG